MKPDLHSYVLEVIANSATGKKGNSPAQSDMADKRDFEIYWAMNDEKENNPNVGFSEAARIVIKKMIEENKTKKPEDRFPSLIERTARNAYNKFASPDPEDGFPDLFPDRKNRKKYKLI